MAKNATGLIFGWSADGVSYTTVAELTRTDSPDVKTDLQDVTSHDSSGGFREFLPGLKDGDVCPLEGFWAASNAAHVGIRTAAYAATNEYWKQTYPNWSGTDEDVVTFRGYVTAWRIAGNVGEPQRYTGQVKVSGMPVWSAS